MIIEEIELLETVVLQLILLRGAVEVGHGVDDGFQPGLVVRVFRQRLQHLRMRLRARAQCVEHLPTNALGRRNLDTNNGSSEWRNESIITITNSRMREG